MPRSVLDRHAWLDPWLSDWTWRLCALFTVAFVLMPPEGLGVDLCLCQLVTHAPCPGCGVTRSGANLVRGHFVRAVEYHPLGPLLIPLIAALGLLALAPRGWREVVRAAVLRRTRWLRPLYIAAVGAFLGYGAARWLGVVLGLLSFPARWP
jgi:hypothetical protein